ncbi:MAG TPA: PAS domain-containing protein [Terriglobales bacterium]|nr:PAS domain-containing protein [Terriglobales bacterium]
MSDATKGEGSGAAPAPKSERRIFPRQPAVRPDEVVVSQEIHLLNQVVQQVKKERAFFQAVLQQMPAGVIIGTAPEGRLIMGNDQVEKVLGRPFVACQNFQEYELWEAFHPDDRPYTVEEWPMTRSIKRGESVTGEVMKFRRDDGKWCHVSCNSAPVRDEDGTIVAGVVSFYEIAPPKHRHRRP